MYSYAISLPDRLFLDEKWRKAFCDSKIKKIEFSCSAATPREQLQQEIASLAKMQQDGQIQVASIHIPFGAEWQYHSTDETLRRQAVENARTFIADCRSLKCSLFTMHSCVECVPLEADERAKCMEAARRSIDELVPVAADNGIYLNIEDLPRTCLGNTAEELAQLVEGFPYGQIGVCFDVNHFCGHPELLPEGIRLNSKRIRSFHISDYDGVDECHWYPGMGVIDWPAIMEEIRRLPNDVLLIFESFGFLAVEAWQKRQATPKVVLDSFVRNVFYLENAAELKRRIAAQEIK